VELPDVPHTAAGGLGEIAIAYPGGTPVGVVLEYSGHDGEAWFADGTAELRDQFNANILQAGYIVAMVRWKGGGWFTAEKGHVDGFAKLSNRPATSARWVYDNIAVPNGVPMKLIGISGGSAQVAYALAFYGIDSVTDAAILISGPPFDEQCRGCTSGGDYDVSERGMIAAGEGNASQKSIDPCVLGDNTWCSFWDANSITGIAENRYVYPMTRTILITGKRDSQDILSRAFHYRDFLVGAGEPIEHYLVNTMGHTLNEHGFSLLQSLVTTPTPEPTVTPTPTPEPTVTPTPTPTATPTPTPTPANQTPVVNAGPDQTITLPDSATLSGSATDDGIPSSPGALTYTWSKISGPGTVTFGNVHAVATTASFSASGSYSLKLTVSDSLFTGTDTVLVTVNPSTSPTADLKVTVTDGKTTIPAGSQSTYTITVTNAGSVAVTGASVTDTFPSTFTGVTFTATQSGGATGFAASGTGNINNTVNMPSGSKITYTVKGRLSSGALGNLSNTAQVTASNGILDPNTANNGATDSDTITYNADLKVTITDGKAAAVPGSKHAYTIVVTNAGPSNVTGAVIQDTFPASFIGVTFTATQSGGATGFSASGSGNINDTVSFPAAARVTYKATGTISNSATGSISDTATVTSNSVSDPNPANNSATDTDSL